MTHRRDVVDHVEVHPAVDVDEVLAPSPLDPGRTRVVVLLDLCEHGLAAVEHVVAVLVGRGRGSEAERRGRVAERGSPARCHVGGDALRCFHDIGHLPLHEQACAGGKHAVFAGGGKSGDREGLAAVGHGDRARSDRRRAVVPGDRRRLREPEGDTGGDRRRRFRGARGRLGEHGPPRRKEHRVGPVVQRRQRRVVESALRRPASIVVQGGDRPGVERGHPIECGERRAVPDLVGRTPEAQRIQDHGVHHS